MPTWTMRVLMRPDMPTIKQWKPKNPVQTKPNQWTSFVWNLNQTNKTVCETEIGEQNPSTGAENHAPFSTLLVLLNLRVFFLHTWTPSVVEMRNFYYVFLQLKVICSTLDGAWGTRHMEFLCSREGWIWACVFYLLNECPEKADSLKINAIASIFILIFFLLLYWTKQMPFIQSAASWYCPWCPFKQNN